MVNKKKPKSRRGTHYSEQEKMDTLLILRECGYVYKEAAKVSGVSIPTLREWHQRYGKKLEKMLSKREENIKKVVKTIEEKRQEYFDLSYDVKMKILNRLSDRIEKSTDIYKIAKAYESVARMEIEAIKVEYTISQGRLIGQDNEDPEDRRFIDNIVFNQIAVFNQDGTTKKIHSLQELRQHESN